MISIPLLPEDQRVWEQYLADCGLPLNYMADYTRMGLVVNRFEQACRLLTRAELKLNCQPAGYCVLELPPPGNLPSVGELLEKGGVYWEYSDIAATLYQA